MGKVLDAIIATMIPSGSVYRNQKPLVSIDMEDRYKGRCNKSCLWKNVLSHSDNDLVKAVEEAIGSKKVVIRKIYGYRPLMPWNNDISGKTMEVIDLLNSMHEEGFPGYDTDSSIVQIFKGIGRFGRKRYMVSLTKEAFETGYPHSGVEIDPVKN